MSILKSHSNGWIISHLLSSCSQLNLIDDQKCSKLQLNPDLFKVTTPFRKEKVTNIKRKSRQMSNIINSDDDGPAEERLSSQSQSEASQRIKTLSEEIIKEGKASGLFTEGEQGQEDCCESESGISNNDNNSDARQIANTFYFETMQDFQTFPKFMMENDSEEFAIKTVLFDSNGNFHRFIIPPKSIVYCDSMDNLRQNISNKYSLVILDPPWRNKFVRRRKRKQRQAGYYLMESKDIRKLPIKDLTKDSSIVVVWCTNKKAHHQQVIQEIFPSWEVQYLATWYWLKVTKEGCPICPFNSKNLKQPYETIILGRRVLNDEHTGAGSMQARDSDSKSSLLPLSSETKVIVSIPSSIHSHKPPLLDVLRDHFEIKQEEWSADNCCELFARYAMPNCTSYGNEVVKLMHESLYLEAS